MNDSTQGSGRWTPPKEPWNSANADVQRSNAAKNLVGAIANATAALVFIAYAEINWWAFAVMAPAAIAGGYFGGTWARRLPGVWLRGMVVAVGLAVGLVMLLW